MKKLARAGASLVLALTASILVPQPLSADELPWQSDWNAAFALARDERRPVFINFYAEWCGPCRAMRKTTLRDPRVTEQLSRFVLLEVDAGKREMAEKLGVGAVPWYSVRDPWEREVVSFVGYQEARYFAPHLARIAGASGEIMEAGAMLERGETVEPFRMHAALSQAVGAEASARVAYRKAAAIAAGQNDPDLAAVMKIEAALTLVRGDRRLIDDGIRELESMLDSYTSSEVLAATWLAIGFGEEKRRRTGAARKAYERGLEIIGSDTPLGKQLLEKLEKLGNR